MWKSACSIVLQRIPSMLRPSTATREAWTGPGSGSHRADEREHDKVEDGCLADPGDDRPPPTFASSYSSDAASLVCPQ